MDSLMICILADFLMSSVVPFQSLLLVRTFQESLLSPLTDLEVDWFETEFLTVWIFNTTAIYSVNRNNLNYCRLCRTHDVLQQPHCLSVIWNPIYIKRNLTCMSCFWGIHTCLTISSGRNSMMFTNLIFFSFKPGSSNMSWSKWVSLSHLWRLLLAIHGQVVWEIMRLKERNLCIILQRELDTSVSIVTKQRLKKNQVFFKECL